jgi:predicted ATPase
VRLLTLTGPAGIGTTRLLIEAATRWAGRARAETLFVDLTPVDNAAMLMSAIARTLEMEESGAGPLLARLRQSLAARRIMLEHVVLAAPDLGELLSGCPELKFLVSSRALLQLRWEHQYRVPPLDVKDLERTARARRPPRIAHGPLFV